MYGEQPFTIHYRTSAGASRHVPDLLVEGMVPQPWIVEFKRDDDPELAAAYWRAALLAPALKQAGYHYLLVPGSTLRQHAYLKNAHWLLRYGRRPCALADLERTRRLFERSDSLQLNQLEQAFINRCQAWNLIGRLILDGQLCIDMQRPLVDGAVITWSQEPSTEGDASWLRAAFGVTR